MSEDWVEVGFAEACEIFDNLRKPINTKERNDRIAGKPQDELYPYYGATGQVGWIDDFLTDGEYVLIGEDGAPFMDYTRNVAYLIHGKTWVNNHAHILKSKFNDKFLCHFLNQFNYRNYVTGTTRLKLTQGALKRIPLPLPPLPEQRAIVGKLEQLFSALDSGIAELQRAQEKLKVYRLAILSVEKEGVKYVPLEEVLNDLSQGWSPKCHNRSSVDEDEWAVIRTSAIQHNRFVEEENKVLPESLEPRKQHELEAGDLLITRAGPRVRVGVCCLVRKTRKRLINCDKVYRMKVNGKVMMPEFLELVLNSANYLKQIEKIKSGISDSGLNLTQTRFLKLEVPVPTLEEQHQIVEAIESRLSVCDKVEERIATNLQKAEALRQSILKKAFEGRLLSAAEVAACKQEADWCPAGELLERALRLRSGTAEEASGEKKGK